MREANDVFPSPDVVSREVGGETVLLHLGSGNYFGLNDVGGRIWHLLDDEGYTLEKACNAISDEYDVPRDKLDQDVKVLVDQLIEHGLLERGN